MAAFHESPPAMSERHDVLHHADPDIVSRTKPLLRRIGLTLALVSTSAATVIGWLALGVETTSTSCGASGCADLAASPFATLFGIPVLAFATGLHAVLWLLLVVRLVTRRPAALHGAAFALAAILLLGTAIYLVLGLVSGAPCALCLTLHALAITASVGVYMSGVGLPVLPSDGPSQRLTFIIALGASAFVIGLAFIGGHRAAATTSAAVDHTRWLSTVCEPATCPPSATFPQNERPEAAVILSDPPDQPTLTLWVDLECPACRREILAMKDQLSDLVTTRRAGLSLVLAVDSQACDPARRGGDLTQCEAPAALVCAARFGAGPSGLSYLLWELSAAPGFFSLEDRRRWLVQHVDRDAAQCLDDARDLAAFAASSPGCDSSTDPAWWCFQSTPSMAIVLPSGARPPAPLSVARELALGQLTGPIRGQLLDRCLGEP
jgi:uncharacterized membrane protein